MYEFEESFVQKLETYIFAGLLNRDHGFDHTRAEFHRNVFPETFIDPIFSELCRAAKDLYQRTGDCDPAVLYTEISTKPGLFRHADLERATSIILEAIKADSVDSISLVRFLPLLRKASMMKRLPAAQKELEKAVASGMDYAEAHKTFVQPIVDSCSEQTVESFDVRDEMDVISEKIKEFKNNTITLERVVPTGYPLIDSCLRGGMRPTQLIIVGARPATGKTTLALNIAANIIDANNGKHVVFVSLEQSTDQLVEKIISIKAQCRFPKTQEELHAANIRGAIPRMEAVAHTFRFNKLHVVEKTDNVNSLATTVKSLCKRFPVGAVIIDYLQLVPSSGEHSRYEAVTNISNNLKFLAKDADVPVVCLAQLSRNSDTDKRAPRLSDLRDSGSIEQDADIGILLYNNQNNMEEEQQITKNRKVVFDIQKNRNGECGAIEMKFTPEESTFTENKKIKFN